MKKHTVFRKKRIGLSVMSLFIVAIFLVALSGCVNTNDGFDANTRAEEKNGSSKDTIEVVTTVFPAYDWAKEIGKGNKNIHITYLLKNGVDMHSYQPSAEDIAKISDCDVFIYVGGPSDSWVKGVLKERHNSNMISINMLDVLGDKVKEEKRTQGMEAERGDDGHDEKNTGASTQEEVDEHVWLSPDNARIVCDKIKGAYIKTDVDTAKLYNNNYENYSDELSNLTASYSSVINNKKKKTMVFADRFPFRYMLDDLGVDYYAAFAGCSAESEADFHTVVFLADQVDRLNLKYIAVTESSDKKLADTVIECTKNKDEKIIVLDSMQSVREKDIEEGETYLKVMRQNLRNVEEAI